MWRFIVRRILIIPLILWAIYTITFMLAITIPGNPFQKGQRNMDADIQRAIEAKYKADDNWLFYIDYMANLINPIDAVRGTGPLIDFGPSWNYSDFSCNQIIKSTLPVSVGLGLLAILIATLVGIPIGVLGAVKKGGLADFISLSIVLIGISLPTFVTGIALLIVFSLHLGWTPIGGWGSLSQMILPAITLSLPFMAYIARLTRLGMIQQMQIDYIRTAKSKGLTSRKIIWQHALKNAFLPVLSYLGPATAMALTGSFVIESIFNINGIGQHFVNSVLNRDRGMILATVLVFSTVIVIFNLLVDITYVLFDPRIEVENKA